MKKLSIIIIFLSLFTIPILNAQVNLQDSLALVSLCKTAYVGNINWLTKSAVSSWEGVIVDSNNRVVSLNLAGTGGGEFAFFNWKFDKP